MEITIKGLGLRSQGSSLRFVFFAVWGLDELNSGFWRQGAGFRRLRTPATSDGLRLAPLEAAQ